MPIKPLDRIGVAESARILGVPEDTVRRWIKGGHLKASLIPYTNDPHKRCRIHMSRKAVEDFAAKMRREMGGR